MGYVKDNAAEIMKVIINILLSEEWSQIYLEVSTKNLESLLAVLKSPMNNLGSSLRNLELSPENVE
jgi:hypothetical protein